MSDNALILKAIIEKYYRIGGLHHQQLKIIVSYTTAIPLAKALTTHTPDTELLARYVHILSGLEIPLVIS